MSFNLDSELLGRSAAIRAAQSLLAADHGMVVLIIGDEKILKEEARVDRSRLECIVLANATYALEHDLPIDEIVNRVEYSEA